MEVAVRASHLHTLYDWGATVTLVTHATAEKVGLKRARQPTAAIAGLSGGCTMVDSYYMVQVPDGDDKVRSVKAMGVNCLTTLVATDVPTDIERRLPQAKGFGKRLARPAGDVEMLIGMDNQGWMPKHVVSSQVKGDNLRLMQSLLSLRCILMGSAKAADPGDGTQGSAGDRPRGSRQPSRKKLELRLADCVQVMMAMMLVMLAGMPECTALRAYDCNNQSSPVEQYSLLDPEPCGNMEKVHPIKRDLCGKIVNIKKERLVQVTRCTASQTVKSTYCGFQSRWGPERYNKFRDLILIEPADCRLAAKTGRFKLNGKDYPFEMNVRRSVIVNLVGGLDNNRNCEVGLFGQRRAAEESNGIGDVQDLRPPGVGQSQRPDGHHQAVGVPDGHHNGPDSGRLRGGHLRLGLLAGCLS